MPRSGSTIGSTVSVERTEQTPLTALPTTKGSTR